MAWTHLGIKHNTQTKAILSEVSDAKVKKASLFLDKRTDRQSCVVFLTLLRTWSVSNL